MTTTAAAAALGLTRAWLWRLIRRGTIHAEMRGRDWWIEAEEVERYRRERKPAHRPKNERNEEMTFQEAINTLAQGRGIDPTIEWDAQIDQARTFVTRAVLEIIGGRDDDGALGDWIAAGEYSGNETAESIAAEYSE